MQTIQNFKVDDVEKKDNLLEVISDKYCRAIIETTKHQPKSAIEITAETKIPISTVYRRIQTLIDNKLLAITGSISDDGKKFFMYKTKISGIKCSYNDGQIDVELILNN